MARGVWAWSPRWKGDAHAGRIETSVILALAPELVGSARDAGNVAPLAAAIAGLRAFVGEISTVSVVNAPPRGARG
jgi:creatinine amidohydrolase